MRRVDEAVKEVLSEGIGDLKDPRIGFVTITGVRTSPDLRQARVFVSVLGARLARELRMKRTPQLAFEYDPSVERGVRMTQLIDELAGDE